MKTNKRTLCARFAARALSLILLVLTVATLAVSCDQTPPPEPEKERVAAIFSYEDECVAAKSFDAAPLSFEARICLPADLRGRGGIILGNYGNDRYPCFSFEVSGDGAPYFYFASSPENASSVTFSKVDLRTGTEVHLAIVNDTESKNAYCYLDGELVQTSSAIEPMISPIPARVGGDYRAGNKQVFKGEIYSVALYSAARTPEQIQSDLENYGSEDLIAAWDLSRIPDSRVIPDQSGGGCDLSWPEIWMRESGIVADYDYTFAAIGDTQCLNVHQPNSFPMLYDWIVENREKEKIVYVLGLGDITDINSDVEWERAVSAHQALDEANIPYALCIGNHDRTPKFNLYFDREPYSSSFEESYGGTIANTYRYFEIGGIKYLIMALDFGAKDDVLDWADSVIARNSDCQVILTTHAYLFPDGTTVDTDDPYAATHKDPENNDGDDMWEKLVSRHKNIVLVLSGHESYPYIVCTQTEGKQGNTVTQILTNHQDLDRNLHLSGQKGAGIVTLLHFSDGGKTLSVECYSMVRKLYYRPENQFTVTLDTSATPSPK